jgi:hypothetical protein
MLVVTAQGLQEIKRRDYASDLLFYRALVLLKFGVALPSAPTFGKKIMTA